MKFEDNVVMSERDEMHLESKLIAISRECAQEVIKIFPEQRPLELREIINEESRSLLSNNQSGLDTWVGHTASFMYGPDVKAYIRHFYPFHPEDKVGMNEMGDITGSRRLVPVYLLHKNITLGDLILGRYFIGLTRYNAYRDNNLFYEQFLIMSLCGCGKIRTNLTFRGESRCGGRHAGSLRPDDVGLIERLFKVMEDAYGSNSVEFLANEVRHNAYFESERRGYNVGLEMAFDNYVEQYGDVVRYQIMANRSLIIATAQCQNARFG